MHNGTEIHGKYIFIYQQRRTIHSKNNKKVKEKMVKNGHINVLLNHKRYKQAKGQNTIFFFFDVFYVVFCWKNV